MHSLPTYVKYKDGYKYHYFYVRGQEETNEAKKTRTAFQMAILRNDFTEIKRLLKEQQ